MATRSRNQIERLETEVRFRIWVRHERFLESLSIEDLEMLTLSSSGVSMLADTKRFAQALPLPSPVDLSGGGPSVHGCSRPELGRGAVVN